MSIETDVYAVLTGVADNVYPLIAPVGATFPAVTYQRVSTSVERSHDGDELLGPLFDLHCLDTSVSVARALAREVYEACKTLIGQAQTENHLERFFSEQKLFDVLVSVRFYATEEEAAS